MVFAKKNETVSCWCNLAANVSNNQCSQLLQICALVFWKKYKTAVGEYLAFKKYVLCHTSQLYFFNNCKGHSFKACSNLKAWTNNDNKKLKWVIKMCVHQNVNLVKQWWDKGKKIIALRERNVANDQLNHLGLDTYHLNHQPLLSYHHSCTLHWASWPRPAP